MIKPNKDQEKKVQEVREKSGMSPEQFMNTADKWLRENGIVTEVTHNNITLNLYMNFPKAKYVEYFMDMQNKAIEIHLHFPFWRYLFANNTELTVKCKELIKQYLPDYTATAEKEIYGKPSR